MNGRVPVKAAYVLTNARRHLFALNIAMHPMMPTITTAAPDAINRYVVISYCASSMAALRSSVVMYIHIPRPKIPNPEN